MYTTCPTYFNLIDIITVTLFKKGEKSLIQLRTLWILFIFLF
jgi:hypothetical protein